MNLWIISIAIFCVGSLLGALNFITTLLNMRTRGNVADAHAADLLGLVHDRRAGAAFVSGAARRRHSAAARSHWRARASSFPADCTLAVSVRNAEFPLHTGGSPILWQHLFWFFGHPEVYIAILPGMGATSHILSTFARKPVFGYRAMVFAIFAIGLLGFFVWGHHMFISGMSPYSAMTFSILTLSIGVPSAVKTFNWLGTLWGAKIRFTTPMLFAIGFVSLVRRRRNYRPGAGPDVARLADARHLFRDRALPPGDGRGLDLRHVCGDLLLVPEDVWPLHE